MCSIAYGSNTASLMNGTIEAMAPSVSRHFSQNSHFSRYQAGQYCSPGRTGSNPCFLTGWCTLESAPLSPRVFAVHMRERGRQIACASDGIGRSRLLDAREIVGVKFQIERTERVLELIAAARADQGHDVVAARLDPGEGKLCDRRLLLAGNLAERLDQRNVLGKILAGETWLARADFARRVLGAFRIVADKSAGQHAIGHQPDTQFAHCRQDFALNA